MTFSKRLWFWCLIGVLCAASAPAQTSKKGLKDRIDDLVKRATAEQARQPAGQGASPSQLIYSELERQYLAGEITARQYMRIMQELRLAVGTNANPRAVGVLPGPMRSPAGTNTTLAVTNAPPLEPAAFGDIERKIDELIKRKEQLDRASATNALPEVEPKTKREKLDYLLRLLLKEKITQQEYDQRRQKVLAEPE